MAARPVINSITQRHDHVREPAFGLLILGIRYLVEVLRLVVVPVGHILLDLLLLFPLPYLEGFVLSIDLVEPLGAFT